MDDLELARACAEFADDKKAENIRILDLRGLSPVTDWLVLCSALSAPQLRAVRDHIEDEMKEHHRERPHALDVRPERRRPRRRRRRGCLMPPSGG